MAGEAGMFVVRQTVGSVLCCKCGIPMQPNAANMCTKCLCSEVDITEGLIKRSIVKHCFECDKYLVKNEIWIKAQLESKELMAFLINKIADNQKKAGVKMVHADFVWTEPHSKRIKLKMRIQKEVLHGAILEQTYTVEFVQHEQMCVSCSKLQANPDQWVASVQLRQHVPHRRTFFYLEQLILKHDAAVRAIKIKQVEQGIDFFFANRSHGVKFVEFISKVAPVRSRHDKQLVSHDPKSNNYNFKYTFSVEISPICREDLICLPPKVSVSLGNLGPIVICTKITNSIALLDPATLRYCFLDADQYWRTSFKSLLTSRQLVEYIILDIEVTSPEVNIGGSKYQLADAQVARVSDFGKNDNIFFIRTHLGHILKPGDQAFGYDLYGANTNDDELDKYKSLNLPEAILIKKSYKEKHRKDRPWKLKNLNMEVDNSIGKHEEEKIHDEYEEFKKDLERNPELRFGISLYRNRDYQPSEMASVNDDEDGTAVQVAELMADLDLSDSEEGDDMRE